MALVPASSHAAAFNGGTITAGLTIDPAAATAPVLLVQGAQGQSAQAILFEVDDDDFNTDGVFTVKRAGTAAILESITGAEATTIFQVGSFRAARAANVFQAGPFEDNTALTVSAGGAVTVHGAGLLATGLVMRGPHAAPADAALAAGDCTLWFDQTDGVGNTKLMVKAKSADGTVKTATILLA